MTPSRSNATQCHRPCACERRCGDVWEPEGGPGIDEPPWPVCKGLPRPAEPPLVEVVLVPR